MSEIKDELPYPECGNCKDLSDCKNVEIALDGFGTVIIPSDCPKEIEILKRVYHKKRKKDGKSV